jgi:hypothetical protein
MDFLLHPYFFHATFHVPCRAVQCPHEATPHAQLIQPGLFVLLYVVKALKTIAITFPITIACCILIRLFHLPKTVTAEELITIDSDEDMVKSFLHEKDQA